MFNKLKII